LFSLVACTVLIGGVACTPKPDIKIGFIGGLSGKFSDLGTSTRNGTLLAIEQTNAKGGIGGRAIALVEQDDKQDGERAVAALVELKRQEVVAVVGPSTSSIATAIVPYANANQLLLIAPTATTNKLTGKDDYFLRATGDASLYGRMAAQMHITKRGIRSVAMILDMSNADYTESWAIPYADEFVRLGGKVLVIDRFKSTENPDHVAIAQSLLRYKPQMVVTVASSVDSALLAQRIKQIQPTTALAGAGWASTERLIELGGSAVEGMLFEQYFDRFDSSAKYQRFLDAYKTRFKADPGFGAVLAFDAASMVIGGLEKSDDPKALKASILAIGTFEGVQNRVSLDAFGDATRSVYFGVVKDGSFAKFD
jgi:branched-chain amino acid transport system substrate-binding protein